MKNLKRVLSLGLASVMLLGMMVVGASATGKDFTDAEDITYNEAVQVLVALNVINGKEDGSYFAPKDNVSRAEMAKMITVVMMGGTDVNSGVKGTPSFTDIAGTWAEGYIEYCYDMGIISGRGDGTFDPNGNVTVTEAAKMLLTAMGYNAEAYKLTGAGWATATNELARSTMYGDSKLYDSLDAVVLSEPASRDVAAQMIWNALEGVVVKITPDRNTNTGEVTWQYNTTGSETLIEQRYKAIVKTGVFDGNEDYTVSGTTVSKGQINIDILKNDGTHDEYWSFPADLDIDYIGEEVKVVFKDGAKSLKTGKADENDNIYGVFVTGGTRVIRETMGNVKNHKMKKAQINLNGTVCDLADSVDVVFNYNNADGNTKTYSKGGVNDTEGVDAGNGVGSSLTGANSDLTTALKKVRGDAIKAVFDSKGKVNKIFVTETKIASVSSINSTNVTLDGAGTFKLADNDVEEGLKKGDVVVYTKLYKAANNDAYTIIKKAEKVSGEVEAYGLNDARTANTNIKLSGKTYKVYNEALMYQPVEDNGKSVSLMNTENANTQIGKDFDLYLVNGFVGAAVKTSADVSNYSVITEVKTTGTAGSVFSGLQLQVMTADGTKEVINVSKESKTQEYVSTVGGVKLYKSLTHDTTKGTAMVPVAKNDTITNADYKVGDLITYSFDKDDNAEIRMEGMVGGTGGALAIYNDSTKSALGKPTTADCVIYVQTEATGSVTAAGADSAVNAEWNVYNIRDLDDISVIADKAYTVAYNNDDTKVVAVFVDLGTVPEGASDDTVYGIVSAYNGRVESYHSYTVQSNGEEYNIRVKDNVTIAKKDLVRFRPTADGIYGTNAIKVYTNGNPAPIGTHLDIIDKCGQSGWVENFSARDNTLTYWYVNTGRIAQEDTSDPNSPFTDTSAVSQKTYALSKDCAIIYIDAENAKSTTEASVDHWSEYTGTKNVMFHTKMDGTDEVIDVMFVETSNLKDIDSRLR